MALKKYSKEEFLKLLGDRIDEAGGLNNLASQLNISNATVSYAFNQVRDPGPILLSKLGLKRVISVSYVSTPTTSGEGK